MNKELIEALLVRHEASPKVTVQEYVRSLMAELGDSIADRHKLYLDTRYWIHLRDAAMGRRLTHSGHSDILECIRTLVANGLAICPVSDVACIELFKQTDPKTRLATADLLDELSLGVALVSEKERVVAEIDHFLTYPTEGLPPIRTDRIWTKAGYSLGSFIPVIDQFSLYQNRLAQKASVDFCWRVTYRKLFLAESLPEEEYRLMEDAAAKITAEMQEYAHEIRSFEQAFSGEIAGGFQAYNNEIWEIIVRHYRRVSGDQRPVSPKRAEEEVKSVVTFLSDAFKGHPKIMAKHIPTIYALTMCHAAVRWDKSRKLNSHDLLDFHHASSGIPHHNAMLTEKPLRALVTAGNVALDKTFSCVVLSKENDVLDYLHRLG